MIRAAAQTDVQPMARQHSLEESLPSSANMPAIQKSGASLPLNYRVFVTPDPADDRLQGTPKILVTPPGDANVAFLKRVIALEINYHESDLLIKADDAVVADSVTLRSLVSSAAVGAHNNRLDVSVTTSPREIKIATTDSRAVAGQRSSQTLIFSRARQVTYGDIRDSLAKKVNLGAAKLALTADGFSVAAVSMDSVVDFTSHEVFGASITAA